MLAFHSPDSFNTIIGVPTRHSGRLRNWCWDRAMADAAPDGEWAHDETEFKIRLADQAQRRSSASMLINRMYSWRGYASHETLPEQPHRVTLVAGAGERTIGTISIGFDSPEGLLVDQLYGDEIDRLRAAGRRACEFIKLAVDGDIRSKRVLGALFHIAMIFARNIHQATDLVIEVNPRHAGFYRRMLGFSRIGEERWNGRVNAPAVLLGMEFERHYHLVQQFGGRPELAGIERSFYPYFFSPHEEAHITRRLAHRQPQRATHA